MINSPDTEKRKRQEINNKRSQATVHIGAEIERWNKLRKETGVSKHEDLWSLPDRIKVNVWTDLN